MNGVIDQANGENWQSYLGDSCQVMPSLPDNSIDLCVHSPPFSNLYIYSDSECDLGNCVNDAEFIKHYEFIIAELYRLTVPGRICAVHCKDLPKYANRDDTAGLKDFPGDIIRAFERHKWSFHSRVTIWKCPVVERERTNNNGLLHKTVLRDRSQLRQGMADYLLMFRKPPVGTLMSEKPVVTYRPAIVTLDDGTMITEMQPVGFEDFAGDPTIDPRSSNFHPSPYARTGQSKRGNQASSIDIWRRYAEPVWWDIDQMNVLNYRRARGDRDERHICPLQLDLIERAVQIWSNPGDVVFSPFAGVASEGVGAIRRGRKFVGIELKPEYFRQGQIELNQAVVKSKEASQKTFLDGLEDEQPEDGGPEDSEVEESEAEVSQPGCGELVAVPVPESSRRKLIDVSDV